MGMSASQMRYCLIAGRKSDVEYQGQQINQQRTTLATVSSSYNSQLLNMTVPTPPSTSDYTQTNYSFTQSGVTCDITSAQAETEDYYVTSNGNVYNTQGAQTFASTPNFQLQYSTGTDTNGNLIYANANTLNATTLAALSDTVSWRYTEDSTATPPAYAALQSGYSWALIQNANKDTTITPSLAKGAEGYEAGTYVINYTQAGTADQGRLVGTKSITSTGSDATGYTYHLNTASGQTTALTPVNDLDNTSSANYQALSVIYEDCLDGNANNLSSMNNQFYTYSSGGKAYYLTAEELATLNRGTGATSDINSYYVYVDAATTTSKKMGGANVTWSESGRMDSFTTTDANNNEVTYSLSVATTTNDDSYNDAYQEYEYQKGVYDQEVQEINAKLSIVEQQDRTLELKLKDLDTQQEALSTEMDSVKKVIDKNIENSFKTFA